MNILAALLLLSVLLSNPTEQLTNVHYTVYEDQSSAYTAQLDGRAIHFQVVDQYGGQLAGDFTVEVLTVPEDVQAGVLFIQGVNLHATYFYTIDASETPPQGSTVYLPLVQN